MIFVHQNCYHSRSQVVTSGLLQELLVQNNETDTLREDESLHQWRTTYSCVT